MRTGKGYTGCNKRKISLSILLALALMMGMMPVQVGAASGDILVTDYQYSNSPLAQNDPFSLQDFTIKNNTGVNFSDVTIDFSDASNIITASGGTPLVMGPAALNAGTTYDMPDKDFRFIGDGYTKQAPVKISYTKNGAAEFCIVNLTFDTAPAATPTPTTIDTKLLKPTLTLEITGSNFTDAGMQNEIRLLVKNTNPSYAAKNVVIAMPEDSTSPFLSAVFGNAMPIAEIKAGGSVDIAITLSTDDYAKAGAYKLPLTVTYANAWGDSFESSASLPVGVRTSKTPGLLVVEAGVPTPSVSPGGTFSLPITIRNQGSMPVNNVKIDLDGLTADGFMLASGNGRISYDRIDGNGAKIVNLLLKAGTTLKAGSYAISFKMEYKDSRGTPSTDTQQLWVPVTGAENSKDSSVEILSITPSRTTVMPEGTFSVSVVLKNTGTAEAKQVKVTGVIDSAVLFPISQNLYILKTLKPGEEKKLTFTYQAQTEAKKGSTPVTINLEVPAVGTETPVAPLSQAISVFVNGSATGPDATKNIPKIIVYSYAADPGLVTAGSEFDLNLSFMNTHSSKTVHNIKANFTVNEASSETGSVFTPVGSSNTFYMDRIAPKGTVERKIRLYTIPDAKSKTYNVTISFDYEDENGNPFKTDEIIGIPVYQPSRFEVNEPSFQTEMMVGQPGSVSFEMYNLGKTILYNVKVKVTCEPEGIMDVTPKSQYYGNYDPGKNEYAEVMLNPMMAGTANGKITVTYETATGEAQESVKEFAINVAEMPPMPDNPEILGPDGKPLPIGPDGLPLPIEPEQNLFQKVIGSIWGKIGIGVVVLGIVAFVVLRIRRKKQEKGLEF